MIVLGYRINTFIYCVILLLRICRVNCVFEDLIIHYISDPFLRWST